MSSGFSPLLGPLSVMYLDKRTSVRTPEGLRPTVSERPSGGGAGGGVPALCMMTWLPVCDLNPFKCLLCLCVPERQRGLGGRGGQQPGPWGGLQGLRQGEGLVWGGRGPAGHQGDLRGEPAQSEPL